MFNCRVEKKVYAKNSFDRFGDDLTEEVLQYLTLEDKIRLECVSKQWQRCIFQKQFVIEIDFITQRKQNIWDKSNVRGRLTSKQVLESLLKKCPNVIKVCFYPEVKCNVWSMIGQNCPRLKSIGYTSVDYNEHIIPFFRMFGHKIEELLFEDYCEELEAVLRQCPNLKKLKLYNNKLKFSENKEFLPNLEEIDINLESLLSEKFDKVKQMKILSDKYSQTMKTLDVRLSHLSAEEVKTGIDCISRFENLRQLKLEFRSLESTQPIDDCLSLIGQKCTKLLKLDLSIDRNVPITERFFDVFYKFKAIKILNIQLSHYTRIKGSIKCFKHCKQLYELDITSPELSEDFFANIASFVPKLQFLRISTEKQFSETFFDSLKEPKYFQELDYKHTYPGRIIEKSKSMTFGSYGFKLELYFIDLIQMPAFV